MGVAGPQPTDGAPGATGLETLRPGQILLREGETDECIFEVVEGTLAVLRGPDEHLIDTLRAGDTFGEIAALAGTARTATVRAIDDAVVRRHDATTRARLLNDPARLQELANLARTRINQHRAIEVVGRVLDIPHDRAADVVGLAEWVHLHANQTLFSQGDHSDAGYLVISGRLAATVDGAQIGEIARGETVGELGLLDRSPRSATVTALRDTTLARFDLDAFQRLTTAYPAVMTRLARTVVSRLARRARPADRARSIVIAMTAPVDARLFATQLAEELGRHGSAHHLWAARIDADLGHPGLIEASHPSAAPAIAEYIEQAEAFHDYLLYEADRDVTNWTRRSLTLADRIVVVMSAGPDEAEIARAEAILAAAPPRARVERWLALVQPRGTDRPSGTAAPADRLKVDRVAHVRAGVAADAHRLARLLSGTGTGLVLGGGGGRGFAHLGVWRALEELGIHVDVIGGASVGAALGALMALQRPAAELVPLAAELFHNLLDYTVPVVSVIKGERITRNVNRCFEGYDIRDLWLPFSCVSTNLTRSVVQVHDRGSVATALRASVAIPGILPPVPFEGDLLVDGGVLNNLPCDVVQATQMVDTVIAVDLSPAVGPRAKDDFGLSVSGWQALRTRAGSKPSPYPGLMSILMRSMITGSVRDRDRALANDGVDCHLDLDLPGVGLLDFERVAEVATRGYEAARPRLEAWMEER